jgi:peptidoglycan-associated lipoprotein
MFKYLIILLVLLASGCATTGDEEGQNGSPTDGSTDATNGQAAGEAEGYKDGSDVSGSSLSDEQRYGIKALSDPNSPLSIRTIYFSLDSSEISAESRDVLVEHGRFISLNPTVQVVLEGHTDERGTRDYNLALGESRSKSVYEFLTAQGVSMTQLEIVSFGEERPIAQEHNDSAWQLNRRVDILYPQF